MFGILIVGGLAVMAHGYQRTTVNLDLVVQLLPQNLLTALEALGLLGYQPRIPVTAEQFADPLQRDEWLREKGDARFSIAQRPAPIHTNRYLRLLTIRL